MSRKNNKHNKQKEKELMTIEETTPEEITYPEPTCEPVEPKVSLSSDLDEILKSDDFKDIRSFVSTLISYYTDANEYTFKPILTTKHRQVFLSIKKALTEDKKTRNRKIILFKNCLPKIKPLGYFKFSKELGRWKWDQKELDACNLLFSFFLNINEENVDVHGLKDLGYFSDEEIKSLEEVKEILKQHNS